MIESYENTLQIIVLLVCCGISLYKAVSKRSNIWGLALFFFASWLLGDIYWLVCLLFYDTTPQISIVSDLSWYASYIFLYLLLNGTSEPDLSSRNNILVWIGPVFAAVMAIFFMFQGDILSNLIYAALMGLLLYSSVSRLVDRKQYGKQRFLAWMILLLCLLEYGMWTASFFWKDDSLTNPYYWFDFCLSISFLLILPATGKAASE